MFEKETGERLPILSLVKRLACRRLLLPCLDQFNPIVSQRKCSGFAPCFGVKIGWLLFV